jgi:peroxiredoxin
LQQYQILAAGLLARAWQCYFIIIVVVACTLFSIIIHWYCYLRRFTLKAVDSMMHSLQDYKSKATLVVFICNHCPYVKARIGDIVALQSRFNTSEVQVIGINSNDPNYKDEGFDNMLKFANEHKLNFPYLIDESQDVARAYGAICTPDPFLFDADRRLVFHGRINDALEPDAKPTVPVMENNIRKLLRGERIEKDFDPSIGCSIKWKNSS